MQLPALIEPLPDRPGYRARLGEPFNLAVEAASPEEARRLLTDAVHGKLAQGGQVVPILLPGHLPLPQPGWLPDDELTQEWRKAIEDYRQERDREEKGRILGDLPDGKEAS